MAKRRNLSSPFSFSIVFAAILFSCYAATVQTSKDVSGSGAATLVTKEQRRTLVSTDSGEISAVEIGDGIGQRRPYHLQFITLDPNSLFLPVLLHADMVFYVHTGSGSLNWIGDEGKRDEICVKRGDIYSLHAGSVFFVRSSLESTRERLRIHAIFADANDQNPYEPYIGAYSTLSDLVLGFDDKILQSAFEVSQEVIEEISSGRKPPEIVHLTSKDETEQQPEDAEDWRAGIIEALVGPGPQKHNSKTKKKTSKTFNLFTAKPDFENCNGWSLEVNRKELQVLKSSNIGVFMVNLTKGSMMAPHWNPRATEIAIVIHGEGMISVVCPSSNNNGSAKETECKNMRFKVSEGDVFAVSRFHPMAQISFNNDSFVFMGFSTMAAKNYPQFLAGKSSVLRTLDRDILAISFNVPNTTIDRWLGSQVDSAILECTSCAEEEESAMKEEIEKERQEEERKRKEDARKREEEEEKARKRKEEEARRREKEKARKREEEEEEARRREEKEARKREEEEEKEARKREEEEEEARKREEEEEARKREEEEESRREEKETRKREEEEEETRREEEEEERQQEQASRRKEEEEAEARRQEKEASRREEEEEEEREEEEGRRPERHRRKSWSEEEEARRQRREREEEEEEGGGREVRREVHKKRMWRSI